jgi:adenylate cyclase
VHGLEREFAPPMTLDAARDPYGRVGTLLGADIVGFTRFLRSEGDDAAAEVSADFRHILQGAVAAHEGVTLEAVADTVLAVFDRPRDAVECAVAARVRLEEHAWPAGFECPTAFVVHSGRLVSKDHKGASAVHVFELLLDPQPGKILVSHSTKMLLEGERLDPWQLRDLGERPLGRSEAPFRVFELVGEVPS